jgi:hypothetical protein
MATLVGATLSLVIEVDRCGSHARFIRPHLVCNTWHLHGVLWPSFSARLSHTQDIEARSR